jgi:protein-L-isoaspartate(D-aspartate) O-methyltransferase
MAEPSDDAPLFSQIELTVVRRAFGRQMATVAHVENDAVAAAFATVPRETFLGPPPWTAGSPFGNHVLPCTDPVVLYQDIVIALDPARGVNNGSPSLQTKLLDALRPKPGEHVVHIGAGGGYYSAILAELVGPSGRVTAVEYDPALADRAKSNLSHYRNVTVVCADGARWPEVPADGIYVNFAVARPADNWIENLAPNGRLVFPLGVPGPRQPDLGGRHAELGAALRIERRKEGFAARAITPAYFVWAEGSLDVAPDELERLRSAFEGGGLDQVRSLIWKHPAPVRGCWFRGKTWTLCYGELL